MRHAQFALAFISAAVVPVAGHAQIRPFAVSFGAGPTFNDHQNTMLVNRGFSAFVRVTSLHSPFLMDIAYLSIPQATPIIYDFPCPSFATSCGGGGNQFLGPVSALTLSPAAQTVERNSWSAMSYRIGPSVSWLPDRQPGTSAGALGARAGVSLLVKWGGPALMLSADYFRMFRGGQAPQWYVPVTFGLQF